MPAPGSLALHFSKLSSSKLNVNELNSELAMLRTKLHTLQSATDSGAASAIGESSPPLRL
jgi:hypothetical protein